MTEPIVTAFTPCARHPFRLSAVVVLASLATPGLASSPDAWQELWKKSEAACIKASGLREGKSNVLVDFDTSVMRIVEGRYPQPHMNNAMGTTYCLYDKKTGKTEIAEPSAP